MVSCLSRWFMVLWSLFFFFLLWTHQQRLKGISPLPLSEEAAQQPVFLVAKETSLVLGALVPRQEEMGWGGVGTEDI